MIKGIFLPVAIWIGTIQLTGGLEENAKETPSQISLTDVTWKDYNDGEYDMLLYFSFSNGSIVDKELQNWGFVKNIEYRDITGDGVDEVIVYTDLLNNIHDNFTVVDFFKIEGNTVTDISPSTDISEVPDIAGFDTEVVSDYTGEYTIVLRMEDYGKSYGVLYTKTVMTIGYDKECWRVIKKQEIPDWKIAYLDYVTANNDLISNGIFWLADVYGDETPELVFCEDDKQTIISVFTCVDREAKELQYRFRDGKLKEYGYGMDFNELWRVLVNVE